MLDKMRWRSTQWFAVAAIGGCTLYGAYNGMQMQTQRPISGTIAGFLIGLVVYALGSLILWLARQFRKRAPRVAWWLGNVLFWLGSAIAVWLLGWTAYGIYQGMPVRLIAFIVGGAVVYFGLGWGARRVLAQSWASLAKNP